MVEDASVRVHSCHSPMREIEVLHDQLLHMFEQDPDLIPKDILVMTPDIETYAPYIQAVFDINSDEEKRIPFSIADQSIRRESAVADSFLAILDLEGSRFGANQVLAINPNYSFAHGNVTWKNLRIVLAESYYYKGDFENAQSQVDLLNPGNGLNPADEDYLAGLLKEIEKASE